VAAGKGQRGSQRKRATAVGLHGLRHVGYLQSRACMGACGRVCNIAWITEMHYIMCMRACLYVCECVHMNHSVSSYLHVCDCTRSLMCISHARTRNLCACSCESFGIYLAPPLDAYLMRQPQAQAQVARQTFQISQSPWSHGPPLPWEPCRKGGPSAAHAQHICLRGLPSPSSMPLLEVPDIISCGKVLKNLGFTGRWTGLAVPLEKCAKHDNTYCFRLILWTW